MTVFRPDMLAGGDGEIRGLTVVGDPVSASDFFGDAVELNGMLYAASCGIVSKFTPALEVVKSVKAQGHEGGSIATDGTYLYLIAMRVYSSYSQGGRLFKFDQDLNLISHTALETGGVNNDAPHRMIYDGGYLYAFWYCSGNSSSTYARPHVAKIDPTTLTVVSNRSVDVGGLSMFYHGQKLAAGGFVAVGYRSSTLYDPIISLFDDTLTPIRHAVLSGTSYARIYACVADATHIYGVGYHGGAGTYADGFGFVVKLDYNLDIVSQISVGDNTTDFRGVTFDKDGNLCVCGFTKALTGGSVSDAFLMRLTPALAEIEQLAFGGTGNEDLLHILRSSEDTLYAFGKETSRNSVSNAMAVALPGNFASAEVSGINYLAVKPSSLSISAGVFTKAALTPSTPTETWSNWNPGLSAPEYSAATVDIGKI